MPYILDIDPQTIDDISSCGMDAAKIIGEFLLALQENPNPPYAKAMANGALYAQMKNRFFIAWDFPDGRLSLTEFARGEKTVRVLGIGRTIKTYAKWPHIFR